MFGLLCQGFGCFLCRLFADPRVGRIFRIGVERVLRVRAGRYGERQAVPSFNTTRPGLGLRGSIQKLESAISTIDESLANNTDALDTAVDAVKGMHRRLTSIEDAVRDFELTIKQAITNVFNATRGRRLLDTANATDRRLLDTANATDRRLLDTLFNGTLGGT